MKQNEYNVRLIPEKISLKKCSNFFSFCLEESDTITFSVVSDIDNPEKFLDKLGLTNYKKNKITDSTGEEFIDYVYTFQKGEHVESYIEKMSNWDSAIQLSYNPYIALEDPAFYKKGKLLVSICSHEKMGDLFLSKTQYETFHELRLPHEIHNLQEPLSVEALFEEYIYQERKTLSFRELPNHSLPESIGEINTLTNLEIYDHALTTLPKTLEKLTELEELRITANQVTKLDFDISKLNKLKILDLSAMPLKKFPKEIGKLNELEELYMECIPTQEESKELMKLKKLKVLLLPEINAEDYSSDFITYVQERKPKIVGIPLSELLGEARIKEIEVSGHYIRMGGVGYIR